MGVQDAAGDELQGVALVANHHRVAGVVASLVANDEAVLLRQQVDDLGLALVAPLGADDDGDRHGTLLARQVSELRTERVESLVARPVGTQGHRGHVLRTSPTSTTRVVRMSDEVRVQRSISAPADRVWAMISDVTRMGEWSPENTGGSWKSGATGPAVGAKFAGKNRNGTKKWSTVCTVTAAEPGSSFAFSVAAGPLKVAEWRYDIAPTDAGCTVTETWTDRRGGLIKKLGKPFSGVADRVTHNRAGMETTLERLAAAAETP